MDGPRGSSLLPHSPGALHPPPLRRLQKGMQAGGVLGVGLVAPIVLSVHKYQASFLGCARAKPQLVLCTPRTSSCQTTLPGCRVAS